jgi:RraA family protein
MLGFRICAMPARPDRGLVEKFRPVVTPHISDSMNRLSGSYGLLPMHDGTKLVGTAFTVRTRPGDNLMIHKALDLAEPGDVIVVDGGGQMANALIGDLMSLHAATRGLAGMVLDGAVRDAAELRASSFPVYAKGLTHRGPYKDGPGEINVPVIVGGMTVQPGDIIVGDEDGLVAIPAAEAEGVLKAALAVAAKEDAMKQGILQGRFDRPFVDETLKRHGVI